MIKLNSLTLIVYDFDGVLTDNLVTVDSHGNEYVTCSRSDSLGISQLKKAGYRQIILSTETNDVVSQRAQKLGLDAFYGIENKYEWLLDFAEKQKIDLEFVAFVGNDVNDLDAMKLTGVRVAVGDAVESVQKVSNLLLSRSGGRGAVREFSDLILEERGV